MSDGDRWHVVPINDTRDHEDTEDCWCRPTTEYVGVGIVVTHNSADGRESYENGRKMH